MGFNVSCISDKENKYNQFDSNINKTPNHPWIYLIKNRQEEDIFKSYDWKDAKGIGTILGYKKLRALDIDGCSDINFVKKILHILSLPINYEWMVRSGSGNRFHVIFYCADHNFLCKINPNVSFLSNSSNNKVFEKLELRWVEHLVLPPSGSNTYQFSYIDIPKDKPQEVFSEAIDFIVESNCLKTFEKSHNSGGGYDYIIDDIETVNTFSPSKTIIEPHLINNHTSENNNFNGYVVLDTETNGLPIDFNSSYTDGTWPRLNAKMTDIKELSPAKCI